MAEGEIVNWGLPTMEAAEALGAHDLVYLSAAGKVSKTTAATDYAIGVVLRDYAVGDKEVSVVPLGKGMVLHMRSSAAITLGGAVVAAADGEIADEGVAAAGERPIGVAMEAATAADEIIEVFVL